MSHSLDFAKWNNTSYDSEESKSLCHFNQYQKFYASKSSYDPESTIEIVLNLSPNDFVNGRQSHLLFTITSTGGTINLLSPADSIATAFKQVQLIARDGQIIDTFDAINRFYANKVWYEQSNHHTSQQRYDEGFNTTITTGTSVDFNVPLEALVPLFKYDQLLPPHLLNGARIRVLVASAAEAFYASSGVPTFSLTNVRVALDAYTMDASLIEKLDNVVIEYPSYFLKAHPAPSDGTYSYANVAANVACSKATRAFAISVRTAEAHNENNITDTAATPSTSVQWRVGNRTIVVGDNPHEQYITTKKALTAFKGKPSQGVEGDKSAITYSIWLETATIHAIDLARGHGYTPVDNNFNIEFGAVKETADLQTVYLFVEYLRKIEIASGQLTITY